jgi:23S rRNA pseudouridine2605 synthase
MDERLQKILARGGIASRRASESLILDGRVSVNGLVVLELGTRADPDLDVITVDGSPVHQTLKHSYIMLNKPAGYVTTRHDPEGRPTVYELVPQIPGLFTVGRLDRETEGLLLLTTDGTWAEQVAHPRYEVEREYEVRVAGPLAPDDLARLRDGIMLDGKLARPLAVGLSDQLGLSSVLTVVMLEGKKREVRMICASAGIRVRKLVRRRLGPILLGWLALGQWRNLDSREVAALTAQRGGKHQARPGGPQRELSFDESGHREAATGESERVRGRRRSRGIGQVDHRETPGGSVGIQVPGHGSHVSWRDQPGSRPRH